MAGFDLVALAVPTRDGVEAWRRRLDELGQPHGGIEIRLYADHLLPLTETAELGRITRRVRGR